MKQVLYFSPIIWSNTDFYRTTGVLPFINHPDLCLRDVSHFGRLTQWDLVGSDVLIMQRPCNPDHLKLIKLAKQCGLKTIADFDDNILNVDQFNPAYRQYQQQHPFIKQCIEEADEVWVSTESIRESFGRGLVVPNAHNDYLLGELQPFNFKSKRVVYRGGHSHQADMYEHADEMVALVNSHPDLDFYFIGDRFTYLEQRCGDNYNSVDMMGLTQYFDYLKQMRPLAMIFPLRDTLLNRGKSNISMMEAHFAGAAYFGNINLPEFSHPFNMPIEAFSYQIGNPDYLSKRHSEGSAYINQNRLLSQVNELRVKSLLSL